MAKRSEILVLDYSGHNPAGPHAGSMYEILAQKHNLTFLTVPISRSRKILSRLRTFHPHPGTWSRKFWRHIEAYQHSPQGYEETTRMYSQDVNSLLRNKCFDLVLQYGAMFGPISIAPKCPYITYHDGNMKITSDSASHQAAFMNAQEYEQWFKLEKNLVHSASRVMTYSRRTRQSYIDDYGCEETQVVAVGASDWVRKADLDWLKSRRESGIDQFDAGRDSNMILFIHTDFSRKGGSVALKAFEMLQKTFPDAKLIVVGPNPELARGKNVFPLGVIRERSQLFSLYRQASLLILPSLNDPFPRVLFEAMAHGLPCVASNVGGVPEQVLDGKTGYLIDPQDPVALSLRMEELLRDEERRRTMGRAGFQHLLANFAPEIVADRVSQQIYAVLN